MEISPPALARAAPSGLRPIRVMIVDDSLTARTVMLRTVGREPDFEVVALANSAEEALTMLETTQVEVILLDLQMPGIGGLAALPRLLEQARGAQVRIVSALTQEGAQHSVEALAIGAADTLPKPVSGGFDADYRETLLTKIRALGQSTNFQPIERRTAAPVKKRPARSRKPARVLAVAGSTGSIHALSNLLSGLPRDFDYPILVTQHLPASFIPLFCRQMELASGRPAVIVHEGMPLVAGTVHIAPGDGHMLIEERNGALVCELDRNPAHSGCTPSADPMFRSLADATSGHAICVVLSGMGSDGVAGARAIVDAGGSIFVQDRASAAVWGMPRVVHEAGLASAELRPDKMAARIVSAMERRAA